MTSKPPKSRSADPSRLDLDEGTLDQCHWHKQVENRRKA
jgi:hypothetical protein